MTLQDFFKKVLFCLRKDKVRFALAGGLVASLYRKEQRLTNDLDFLIFSESESQQKATEIIESFGLKAHVIRKADLEGGPLFAIKKKSTEPYMIVGRADQRIGLDFILPKMPWFESALIRAEQNNVDFGFGRLPCLTVEDVIIAKLFSYKNDQTRFNDLDDLKSIFLANHPLDLDYLCGQIQRLELSIPPALKTIAPKTLTIVSRRRK